MNEENAIKALKILNEIEAAKIIYPELWDVMYPKHYVMRELNKLLDNAI